MTARAIMTALTLLMTCPSLSAAGPNLRVTATNLQSDEGSFIVWVYDNPDSWLSDRWRTQKILRIAGNRADDAISVELTLPPGEYALSVFQDLNDDGKLERNFIGLPKEPAGLSNNLRPKFGPPKFEDAKFTVSDVPAEQRIELR